MDLLSSFPSSCRDRSNNEPRPLPVRFKGHHSLSIIGVAIEGLTHRQLCGSVANVVRDTRLLTRREMIAAHSVAAH